MCMNTIFFTIEVILIKLTSGGLCCSNRTLSRWLGSLRHCWFLSCCWLCCRRRCLRCRRRGMRSWRLWGWNRNSPQKLKCICAIIFAVDVVVLHPGTIPEHKSTNARFVTDLLQWQKNRLRSFLRNFYKPLLRHKMSTCSVFWGISRFANICGSLLITPWATFTNGNRGFAANHSKFNQLIPCRPQPVFLAGNSNVASQQPRVQLADQGQ